MTLSCSSLQQKRSRRLVLLSPTHRISASNRFRDIASAESDPTDTEGKEECTYEMQLLRGSGPLCYYLELTLATGMQTEPLFLHPT